MPRSRMITGKIIKQIFYLLTVLFLILVGLTCQPPPTNRVYLEELLQDSLWTTRLIKYLDLGYLEAEDQASLIYLSPKIVRIPWLYSTYGAVSILKELNQEVPHADKVIQWIRSLQNPKDIYFDDKQLDFTPLHETALALTVLRKLGISPQSPESIVDLINSLDRQNELFFPGQDIENLTQHERLKRTFEALDILLSVPDSLGQELQKNCYGRLSRYLENHNLPTSALLRSEGFTDKTGWFFAITSKLAEINPAAVPDSARKLIATALLKIPYLSAGAGDVVTVYHVVNAASHLGFSQEYLQKHTAAYLRNTLFPTLAKTGGYESLPGCIDFNFTYLAVKIIQQTGVSFPFSKSLLQQLERYHIGNGWSFMSAYVSEGGVRYACYALSVAQQFNWKGYNTAKLAKFFQQFLTQETLWQSPKQVFFASQGLELLNKKYFVSNDLLSNKVSKLLEKNIPNDHNRFLAEIYPVIEIFRRQNQKLPERFKERVAQDIEKFAEEMIFQPLPSSTSPPLVTFYRIQQIQQILGLQCIPGNTLAQKISGFRVKESGGFKAELDSREADIESSYYAVKTLTALGKETSISRSSIKKFVMSCKADHGFTFNSVESYQDFHDSDPNLENTFYALSILEMLSR